jgi:hypothetical protein
MREASNVDQLYEEMRHGGPMPSVPVIVYTAMGIDASQTIFSTEEVVRAQNAAKLATNSAFVESLSGAENRVLEDASHAMIHAQRPTPSWKASAICWTERVTEAATGPDPVRRAECREVQLHFRNGSKCLSTKAHLPSPLSHAITQINAVP